MWERVSRGNKEDVRRAIDAAEQALKVWSKTAPAARGEVLRKAARLIDQHVKELAESLTKEQGKPLKESTMEIRRFQHTLEYYAGLGKNLRSVQNPHRRRALRKGPAVAAGRLCFHRALELPDILDGE